MEIKTRCRPGQRLDSEEKLAARHGVSVRTIREALSALASQGLVERQQGIGTFVSTQEIRRPVGLWINIDPRYPLSIYGFRVLHRMHALLVRQGLGVRIYLAHGGAEELDDDLTYQELLEDVRQDRLGGLALVQGSLGLVVPQELRQRQRPIVAASEGPMGPGAGWVTHDRRAVAQTVVRYFVEQGCRRIAYLSWWQPETTQPAPDELVTELRAHGLTLPAEWMHGDLHPTLAGAGYEQFREIWASRPEKPDGLFVADDMLLPDVVTAIFELGIKVPDQLRVVAHANKGMVTCPFFPAARLEFDPDEQAQALVELLMRQLRGERDVTGPVVLGFRWRTPVAVDSSIDSRAV